jgi:hypothetical protein
MTPRIGDEYMTKTLQLVAYPSAGPRLLFSEWVLAGNRLRGREGLCKAL